MSTASQHMRTDTHVSPSHSQSKVSPIPVQSYPGIGAVQHGFSAHPGNENVPDTIPGMRIVQDRVPVPHIPVPVPVQVPSMHHMTGNDIASRGDARPNGDIPGQLPSHYKTTVDSPKMRPRPGSGRHPSANVSFDGDDSLASNSSAVSIDPDMANYTEQMSRALEQFDDLLSTRKPSIIQTSF